MGEDFQAGVCGSSWWSSPRGSIGFSPCLVGVNDFGSFGWPSHDLVEMKARSSATRDVPTLVSNQGPMLFDQYIDKPSEDSLINSTSRIIDPACSSTTTIMMTDWNQNLISGSGSSGANYQSHMTQENMTSSRLNFREGMSNPPNNQIQKDWSVQNFSLEGGREQISSTQGFSQESSLPMTSSSFGYPSTLTENLFGDDQLPLENQPMNFPSPTNYRTNLNQLSSSLGNLPSLLHPPQPKQQEISSLHLTSNAPFWTASTTVLSDASATIFPSTQASMVEKPSPHNQKTKYNNGVAQDTKKSSAEPAFKRPRIETPSPLPTFKVRKEKLGDRITALQQLVSPFGKTDTASVLQEAIDYIRFLHDQVKVFTPYKNNGAPIQQQQNCDNSKDPEGPKQDLRGRGLCLVPISSTFPVANETTADFWTPSFERTFR